MEGLDRSVFARAFRDSLPVLMGYVTMGFAGGVLLAVRGNVPWAPLWATFTSVTFVSGTLQFAIVKPLAELAPVGAVALLTLLINFRYAFYGFSLVGRWRGLPWIQKAFLVHGLTDETYALEVACPLADPAENVRYCTLLTALNVGYWVAGVTAGALAVCALECAFTPEALQAKTRGVEFAMVALFIVIFTDQMREVAARRKARRLAGKGGAR